MKRENKWKDSKDDYLYENEKEIKEKCKIRINNNNIDFNYYYKFKKEGKYNIEYSFKNNLTKTNHMFGYCYRLINLNLSNFNTQNVTNMRFMFFYCNSLKKKNIITKDNKIIEAFEKKEIKIAFN